LGNLTAAIFVDTPVLLYAVGGESPWREACRALLGRVERGTLTLHMSIEAIQEAVFHRMRMADRAAAVTVARHFMALGTCHDVSTRVMDKALELISTTQLRGRDALHAATALSSGFSTLVTTDADFQGIPGLDAISPDQAIFA
jgi:predicted nucleic acid-binding protein